MPERTKKTEQQSKQDKSKAFDLITEAEWKINFLRDVAAAHALNAEEEHVGITPEGEQGLALILAGIGRDLNQAMELL